MNRKKKRNIRFFIGLYMAQVTRLVLKILKKNATQLPGKVALKVCPDFLSRVGRPEKIIAVTGTNGKTTTCNLIIKILKESKFNIIDNRLGSNTYGGIASALLASCDLLGNVKEDMAVFEVDERSSKRIYEHIEPTYLVCTNLFRDSIKRNAHTEFILRKINPFIPKSTRLILNADDLISSSLGENNEKVFFGIGELDADTRECKNIVCDIVVCPKCKTRLKYNYLHYHHIGNSYCPNCDFKSYDADFLATKLDYENKTVIVTEKGREIKYNTVTNNLFNVYNLLAVVTLLRQLDFTHEAIQGFFKNIEIVSTRFTEEKIGDLEIITQMSKGQNPVACSRAVDYAANESGNKAVIFIIMDIFDEVNTSENITWLYDIDFEFLNKDDIKQIIVGGIRSKDILLRLLLAGLPKEKIVIVEKYDEIAEKTKMENIEKLIILHDIYAYDLAVDIKNQIVGKMGEKTI